MGYMWRLAREMARASEISSLTSYFEKNPASQALYQPKIS